MRRLLQGAAALSVAALFLGCSGGEGASSAPEALVAAPYPEYKIRGRCPDPMALTYAVDMTRSPVAEEVLRRALTAAADLWNETGLVRFRPADGAASLVVGWHGPRPEGCTPFLEWHGSVAHAGPVAGAEPTFIHLDSEAPWTEDGETGFGLVQTLAHELGHVVGLEHSEDETALMYRGYDVRRRGLGLSDRLGLQALYSAKPSDARPGDLRFEGRADLPVLRAAVPPEHVGWTVLDADLDGRDDLVTWSLAPGDVPRLKTWHFDDRLRLVRTMGPRLCRMDPRLPGSYLTRTDGGEAVAIQTWKNGKYAAFVFDETGMPTYGWPEGRPMRLENGLVDEDGDGVLDEQGVTQGREKGVGDFNGDGKVEKLVR